MLYMNKPDKYRDRRFLKFCLVLIINQRCVCIKFHLNLSPFPLENYTIIQCRVVYTCIYMCIQSCSTWFCKLYNHVLSLVKNYVVFHWWLCYCPYFFWLCPLGFFFFINMKYMYKCVKCNIHVMCRYILFTTFIILLLKF